MTKHRVLFDMINNSIIFLPKYYIHFKVHSFLILIILMINTKIIPMVTQIDILPNQILKKGLAEKIDKFLIILEELLKGKK